MINADYIVSVESGEDGNPLKGITYFVRIEVTNHPYGSMRENYDSPEERVARFNAIMEMLN